MPQFALELRAELENITELQIDFPLVLDMRQSGGTEERLGVEVDPSAVDPVEVFGSKGTVDYKMKWDKKDRFEATLKLVNPVMTPLAESSKWTRIAVFETRGLDVIGFHPKSATVKSPQQTFTAADISDLQDGFSEYDERAELPVSLTELECRIVTL